MPPTSLWVLYSNFISSRVTALVPFFLFFFAPQLASERSDSEIIPHFRGPICETRFVKHRIRVLRCSLYNTDSTRIDRALLSSRGFHSVISLSKRLGDRLKNRDVNKMRRVGSSTLFFAGSASATMAFTEKRSEDNGQLMVFVTQPFPSHFPVPCTPETRYRRRLSSYYALKN